MNATKQARARYSVLVRELSALSRNGWAGARPVDYQPLERELRELAEKLAADRRAPQEGRRRHVGS